MPLGGSKSKGRKEFEIASPGATSKIARDAELGATKRRELQTHLDAWTGGDIRTYVQEFFSQNLLNGCEIALPRTERLATAQLRELLIQSLQNQGISIRTVRKEFDRVQYAAPATALTLIARAFGGRAVRYYQSPRCIMWSFRNLESATQPLGKDPTDGIVEDFVCRIGAGYTDGGAFGPIWLLVHHPVGKVAKPTVCDAGIYHMSRFEPGGLTRPDVKCIARPGLNEVVHETILWNSINELATWTTN